MTSVTIPIETPSAEAASAFMGSSWIAGLIILTAVAPPMAAAKTPAKVMPIWIVARNRSGSSLNFWMIRAFLLPSSTSCRILILRVATTAISAAAKKPLMIMKKMMSMTTKMVMSLIKS